MQARAGSDVIAPSDMMDGRVGAIRDSLDSEVRVRIRVRVRARARARARVRVRVRVVSVCVSE